MQIIELILNEDSIDAGVQAISIVGDPAIESNFIALSKEPEIKLAKIDEEKRILLGPALIPNKTIYRKDGDREYYVYFSNDTIRKASQLFLKNSRQGQSTLEHAMKLTGLTVVESWIVDDTEKDKSAFYGMKMPVGTWMTAIKVDNEQVWNNEVKNGNVKGFSIEGYFADKTDLSHVAKEDENEKKLEEIKKLLSDV